MMSDEERARDDTTSEDAGTVGIGARPSGDPTAPAQDEKLAPGEAPASEIDGWTEPPLGHREGPPADDDAVREKGASTQG
jgi:hypothetical protein